MINSGNIPETQANHPANRPEITAAVLIIGDEILSGRTQDKNLAWLAEFLGALGIHVLEARVVADDRPAIIAAVHDLRRKYTYVFTTGGIGPTPDDMTAETMAEAFGLEYGFHPEAKQILADYYGDQATDARMRMAKMPVTAKLIANPVSHAPGFYVENVFVLAGVPKIMQAMMMSLEGVLTPGRVRHSLSFTIHLPESKVAGAMTEAMQTYSGVAVGSYPKMLDGGGYETSLVLRGYEMKTLEAAQAWLQNEIKKIV